MASIVSALKRNLTSILPFTIPDTAADAGAETTISLQDAENSSAETEMKTTTNMLDSMSGVKKRRKIQPAVSIIDIPDNCLSIVTEYLVVPSRAMLAVALSGSPSSLVASLPAPPLTRRIFSWESWGILDFGEIDRNVAANLGDVDLCAVLLCIDARNCLKRLNLAGCVNVKGHGLVPLRHSAIIEKLDLSIVLGFEDENLPLISQSVVLPTLHSIVDATAGSALMYLHLPKKWRIVQHNRPGNDPLTPCPKLDEFLSKYDQLLHGREGVCTICDDPVEGNEMCRWELAADYGIQSCTCYGCDKKFCLAHHHDYSPFVFAVEHCPECDKNLCRECVPARCSCYRCSDCTTGFEPDSCVSCESYYPNKGTCDKCQVTCNTCFGRICHRCSEEWGDAISCGNKTCKEAYCGTCYENNMNSMHECSSCYEAFCSPDCGVKVWMGGKRNCAVCIERIKDKLIPVILKLKKNKKWISKKEKKMLRQHYRLQKDLAGRKAPPA